MSVRLSIAKRDRGIARVEANTPEEWKVTVDQVIGQLARSGEPFTSDDVRDQVSDQPLHPNAWGARFLVAQREGVIRRVGFTTSRRPAAHARRLPVYQGQPRMAGRPR